MKEKRFSLSGDSFEVKTLDGRTAFKGDNNMMTLRDTKMGIFDAEGTKIAVIKSKFMSLHGSYFIMDGNDSKTLFTVKPSFRFGSGLLGDLPGGDMKIYRGTDESKVVYRGKKLSGLWNKTYGIFVEEDEGERLIGTIGQTNKLASIMPFGRDAYQVEVEPGVDAALICILGMLIDDIKEGDSDT